MLITHQRPWERRTATAIPLPPCSTHERGRLGAKTSTAAITIAVTIRARRCSADGILAGIFGQRGVNRTRIPRAGRSVIEGAISARAGGSETANRGRMTAIAIVASISAKELPTQRRGPLLNGKYANRGSREARPWSQRSG